MTGERVLFGVGTWRTVRAHWALHELALDYRTERVRTRTGDTETEHFTRLNPRGKIPVLCDGEVTVSESPAIVTYLGERYSAPGAPMVPTTVEARARYFEWLSFISMELDATSLYVLRRHEHLPEIYGDAPPAIEAARAYFARMIEAAAAMADAGEYLLGKHFSGVDILMLTCLDWAVDYGLPLPDAFAEYRARVAARPAYASALEASRAP